MNTMELANITRDPDMQSRAGIDDATVSEYAAAMQDGEVFPALKVMQVGDVAYLVDGWHRFEAARRIGRTEFEVEVSQGTRRDALLTAIGANLTHGLRPSRDDKRRAIRMMLLDPEWRGWSNTEIGRRAGADKKTVGKYRQQMIDAGEIQAITERKTADGRVMDVSGIKVANQERTGEIPGEDWPFVEIDNLAVGIEVLRLDWRESYRKVKLDHATGGLLFIVGGTDDKAPALAFGSDAAIAFRYVTGKKGFQHILHEPQTNKPVLIVNHWKSLEKLAKTGEKIFIRRDYSIRKTIQHLTKTTEEPNQDTNVDVSEQPDHLFVGLKLELTDGRVVVVKDQDIKKHTVTITRDGGRGNNQTNVMREKNLWKLIKRERGYVSTSVHHLDFVRTRTARAGVAFGIALVTRNESGRYVEIWDGFRAQSHKPHTITVISRFRYPGQIEHWLDAMNIAPEQRQPTYEKTEIKPLMPAVTQTPDDEDEVVWGDLDESVMCAMEDLLQYLTYEDGSNAQQLADHIDFLLEALPQIRERFEVNA